MSNHASHDPDWADGLPDDVIVAIFDHVPTRAGIRGAAMTCRSWHRASYHHAAIAATATVAGPAVSVPRLCRYLSKTLWRVRDLTCCCCIGLDGRAMTLALPNLRWLETLDATFLETGADASPIVCALPASLTTLRLRGPGWTVDDSAFRHSGVRDLHVGGCVVDSLLRLDGFPRLDTLSIIECVGSVEVPRGVRRLTMRDAGTVSYEYPNDEHDPHAIFFGDDRVRDNFFAWNVVFSDVEDELDVFDEFEEGYVFPPCVQRVVMSTRSLYVAYHEEGTNSFVVDPDVAYLIDILPSDDFIVYYNEQLPNL